MPEQDESLENRSPDESEIFSQADFPSQATPPQRLSESADAESEFLDIQELSLADLLKAFRRAPVETWQAFFELIQPNQMSASHYLPVDALEQVSEINESEESTEKPKRHWRSSLGSLIKLPLIRLAIYVIALLLVVRGGQIWAQSNRAEAFPQGVPYFMSAFLLWLFGEFIGNWAAFRAWTQRRDSLAWLNFALRSFPILGATFALWLLWDASDVANQDMLPQVTPALQLIGLSIGLWFILDFGRSLSLALYRRNASLFPLWLQNSLAAREEQRLVNPYQTDSTPFYLRIPPMRFVFALGATLSSIIVWFGTSQNNLPTPIFYLWLGSVALWGLTFAPFDLDISEYFYSKIERLKNVAWRDYLPVILAIILITGVALWFRFYQLNDIPREMTDDHVEKILDSALIRDGYRPIFLANNGGREPFQMYAIALGSHLPNLGVNHFTLKVIAALESLLTIPAIFWMAYELAAGQTHRRRILIALFAAALLAGSYWHLAITRQALRIPLTPLVAAILLIYLARALRYNMRGDFIKAGIVLGFGLYMYQAVRMLPVVIVVAVGLAIYFRAVNWRERFRYVLNLTALVWIAFMAFLPMFHYSIEFPDLFWRRTAGRLLGDDIIEEQLADGSMVMRNATVEERWQAFSANIPVLTNNVRNALLMFNRKGDVAAISGIPNAPTMDVISGGLLILGLGAWMVLAVQRRDVVYWLVPIGIFIMLLPSALSIAFPVENPSHTRTSGAIPMVYLLAAVPLALIAEQCLDAFRKRSGQLIALLLCTGIVLTSYNINAYNYFEVYPPLYAASFDPYTEIGRYLRGFTLSNGSYGNAFMIGYPHWWSHRAIGLAAGLEEQWTNGIVNRDEIPRFLSDASQRNDQFRLNPQRDLLFFYSPNDEETEAYLTALFPSGYAHEEVTYAPNNNYRVYLVPALGDEGFQAFLQANLTTP